jgi:hypothetical protein
MVSNVDRQAVRTLPVSEEDLSIVVAGANPDKITKERVLMLSWMS